MADLPGSCPFCGGALEVTSFACTACEATVGGRFTLHKLFALDAAQADFVVAFLRNRGNIKEVERELGVSYPTVRARLDGVIRALGFAADDEGAGDEIRARRAELLAAVERGEMTAAAAAAALKKLNVNP